MTPCRTIHKPKVIKLKHKNDLSTSYSCLFVCSRPRIYTSHLMESIIRMIDDAALKASVMLKTTESTSMQKRAMQLIMTAGNFVRFPTK